MASLKDLLSFGNLKLIFQQTLAIISQFAHSFFDQETRFFQFFFDIQDTVERCKKQIEDFKDWSFDYSRMKNKVISFPKAKDAAVDLKDDILDLFTTKVTALVDELKQFAKEFEARPQPTVGAEADAGAVTNITLKINDVLNKLNALAKLINDVLDFTQQIADIKKRIQGLDDFFLQQGNPRKTISEKSRLRLGKLHQNL